MMHSANALYPKTIKHDTKYVKGHEAYGENKGFAPATLSSVTPP
jgi:hypothetical protein